MRIRWLPEGGGLVVLVGLAVAPSLADARLSRVGSPSVSFNAVGPAGLTIVGTTSELKVDEDGGAVVIVVPLGNLSTGISLRDRHMKEKYLQVAQYPNAELTVPRAALKFPASGESASGDVPGVMKLHGQSRPVRIHFDAKNQGTIHVNGSVRINMKEYGIDVPSYLGITVKPDVAVTVQFDVSGA